MVRVALVGLILGVSSQSGAVLVSKQDSGSRWAVHYGPAFSVALLGSVDRRSGALLGLQYSQPMKQKMLRRGEAAYVLEAYHLFTKGGGISEFGRDRSFAYGLLAQSRWFAREKAGGRIFFELGWGLQVQETITHDMGSRLNSTPTGGFGWQGRSGGTDLQLTIRLMHMSSAGLIPRNLGQNHIQVLFGLAF